MNIKFLQNHRTMSYQQNSIKEVANRFNFRENIFKNDFNDNEIESFHSNDIINKRNSIHDQARNDRNTVRKKRVSVKEFPKHSLQTCQSLSLNSSNGLELVANNSECDKYSNPGNEAKLTRQINYNLFENSLKKSNKTHQSQDFNQIRKPYENHNINTGKLVITRPKLCNGVPSQTNYSEAKISSRTSHLDTNDGLYDSRILKDNISHNSEIDKYEQKAKMILQYYFEKYWSKEQKNPQKILEYIPNNLSVHRLKLEKFKQFNNKNKDKSNHSVDLKQSYHKIPINKNVHFDNQVDEIDSDNQKDYSKAHSSLYSKTECLPSWHSNSKSNNSSRNHISIKSILKKKDEEDESIHKMDNKHLIENQSTSNRNSVSPFNCERIENLKQQQIIIDSSFNTTNETDKETRKETKPEFIPSATEEKNTNQNILVNDILKITPIIPENKIEANKNKRITNCNSGPSRLQTVYELPINKEQKFYTNSIIESNKKFQMFGSPLQVCNFRNLRDDDYTRAWKIKL